MAGAVVGHASRSEVTAVDLRLKPCYVSIGAVAGSYSMVHLVDHSAVLLLVVTRSRTPVVPLAALCCDRRRAEEKRASIFFLLVETHTTKPDIITQQHVRLHLIRSQMLNQPR